MGSNPRVGTWQKRTAKSGLSVLFHWYLRGSLLKIETVRLIEVSVWAYCCSSLVTAHTQRIQIGYVLLRHFTVETSTEGVGMVGSATLHLRENFYTILSFPKRYRVFDSNFCHRFLHDLIWVLCISLDSHSVLCMLPLQREVCAAVCGILLKRKLHFYSVSVHRKSV